MNIKVLKQFDLGSKLGYARGCEVNLGNGEIGMLFVYSENTELDPCLDGFAHQKYPMQIACFGDEGQMLWHKTLGMGLVTGTWFCPFMAFDLDGDGVDEIWFTNNLNESSPFLESEMIIERLDSLTGETIGRWPYRADFLADEGFSCSHRYFLCGGYAEKEPILVAIQGTYKKISMQAYDKSMNTKWEKIISPDDGPRGAHSIAVFDFNNDGIEEILYGEHMISLEDGKEVICYDKENYNGHTDILIPFINPITERLNLFTCRESGDYEGCPRVVTFDMETGDVLWKDIYSDEFGPYVDDGHIHYGFLAETKNGKVAFAYRCRGKKQTCESYTYDAATGEPIDFKLPVPLYAAHPVDLNGDGISEFVFTSKQLNYLSELCVSDDEGNKIKHIGGWLMNVGKYFDLPGEQIVAWYPQEGKVRIWGDTDAVENEKFKERYSNGFLKNAVKTKGIGYNWNTPIDCAFC